MASFVRLEFNQTEISNKLNKLTSKACDLKLELVTNAVYVWLVENKTKNHNMCDQLMMFFFEKMDIHPTLFLTPYLILK